jgi:carboxyl-terminal processing protease
MKILAALQYDMTSSVNETRAFERASHRRRCDAHIASVLIVASLSIASARAHAQSVESSRYHKLEAFSRALAHIEQSYVDVPDGERLMSGAIRGMVEALDPHSSYLDRDALRILQDDAEGRYAGIGTEIDARDGWLTVSAVLEASPAERAGIKPGDRFLAIEGLPARDLPLDEAIRRMRGEPGTRVRITLRRANVEQAIERELTREIVAVRAVDARVLDEQLVVVRLRVFQDTTGSELHRALDEASAACASKGGIRGLVLDLRDNPGGLVSAAVTVADELLEEGVIVQTRGRGERVLQTEHASRAGTRPRFPIVALVNARTASAAEILAGALRDHKRAVIVGQRTFGKGSVQNIIDLPDGSAIKLTTARYYTPAGHAIQARGIEPDIAIASAAATLAGEPSPPLREADLEGHLPARDESSRGARSVAGPIAPASAQGPYARDYEAGVALQVLRTLIATGR